MQIKIAEVEFNLLLTDELLDNDNFVEVVIDYKGNDPKDVDDIVVSVDELLVAIEAFKNLQINRLKKDKLR